jgi:ABC-2 type transport system ATP-binding protein
VAEHFSLVARLYAIPDMAERMGPLLDELELTGKQAALPGELSRGMRQKVVIGCGLVRNPPVLLFDEPLTGLDPIGIRRMRDTIQKRARDGAAVLLSSHLLPLVQELCNRVVIMHRGRKLGDGTVQELAARVELHEAGSSLEDIFLRVTGHDVTDRAQ